MPADKGFYALVTLGGEGVLRGDFEDVPLKRGKSVFHSSLLVELRHR